MARRRRPDHAHGDRLRGSSPCSWSPPWSRPAASTWSASASSPLPTSRPSPQPTPSTRTPTSPATPPDDLVRLGDAQVHAEVTDYLATAAPARRPRRRRARRGPPPTDRTATVTLRSVARPVLDLLGHRPLVRRHRARRHRHRPRRLTRSRGLSPARPAPPPRAPRRSRRSPRPARPAWSAGASGPVGRSMISRSCIRPSSRMYGWPSAMSFSSTTPASSTRSPCSARRTAARRDVQRLARHPGRLGDGDRLEARATSGVMSASSASSNASQPGNGIRADHGQLVVDHAALADRPGVDVDRALRPGPAARRPPRRSSRPPPECPTSTTGSRARRPSGRRSPPRARPADTERRSAWRGLLAGQGQGLDLVRRPPRSAAATVPHESPSSQNPGTRITCVMARRYVRPPTRAPRTRGPDAAVHLPDASSALACTPGSGTRVP